MITIVPYQSEHLPGVDALWKDAFPNDAPWNTAAVAVPEKVSFQPGLLFVAIESDTIVGSIMVGYDGHRGWISRIAVLASHRNFGIGQALIAVGERHLADLGCTKVNLQVVESNAGVVSFYEQAGYQIEKRISMSKHLDRSVQTHATSAVM